MPKLAKNDRLPRFAFPTICLAPMPELSVYAGCFESLEDGVAQYEGRSSDRGVARKITNWRKAIDGGAIPDAQRFWIQHPLEVGVLPWLVAPFRDVLQAVVEHERYWLHPERVPTTHAERITAAKTWLEVPEWHGVESVGVLELLLQQVLFSYALYRAWRGCEAGAEDYLDAEEGGALWLWKYHQAFVPVMDGEEKLIGSVEQMLNFSVQRLGYKDWKGYALQCELDGGNQATKSITDKFRRWTNKGFKAKAFIEQFAQSNLVEFLPPPLGAILFPVVIDFVCRGLIGEGHSASLVARQCATFYRYVDALDNLMSGQEGRGLKAQPQFG